MKRYLIGLFLVLTALVSTAQSINFPADTSGSRRIANRWQLAFPGGVPMVMPPIGGGAVFPLITPGQLSQSLAGKLNAADSVLYQRRVAGSRLMTTAEGNKLSLQTGTNTGDQTFSYNPTTNVITFSTAAGPVSFTLNNNAQSGAVSVDQWLGPTFKGTGRDSLNALDVDLVAEAARMRALFVPNLTTTATGSALDASVGPQLVNGLLTKAEFVPVDTYALMKARLPVAVMTVFLVAADEKNNPGSPSEYHVWPNGTIMWQASQQDTN